MDVKLLFEIALVILMRQGRSSTILHIHTGPGSSNLLHCQDCHGYSDLSRCRETTCSHNTQCYTQTVEHGNGIRYWKACASNSYCKNGDLIAPNTRGGKLLCAKCCNHSDCNAQLCKQLVDHCMHCVVEGLYRDCSRTEQCGMDEVCFVQKLQLTVNSPLLPDTYYHGGCISKSECSNMGNTSVQNEHGLATVVEGECCSSNDCNKQIMEQYKAHTTTEMTTTKATTTTPQPTTITTTTTTTTTTTPQPTTTTTTTTTTTQAPTPPPPMYYCMECLNQGIHWNCSYLTKCGPNEVCFLQEMEYTISIPSLPRTYYHGGCINSPECPKVSHTSVVDEHGLATVVQGECCSSFVCNRQLMKKYEARGMCEVCQGPNCGPGSGTLSLCPVDSPLCMTTVVNNQHGHKDYIKRCASEYECDQKWLGESSLKSECMGFKKDNSYLFDFTCHYCCKTKDCDKDIVPNKDTMYTGTH